MIEWKEQYIAGLVLWNGMVDDVKRFRIRQRRGHSKRRYALSVAAGKGMKHYASYETIEAAQRRAEELLAAGSFNNKQGE